MVQPAGVAGTPHNEKMHITTLLHTLHSAWRGGGGGGGEVTISQCQVYAGWNCLFSVSVLIYSVIANKFMFFNIDSPDMSYRSI